MDAERRSRQEKLLIFLLIIVPTLLFLGWSQGSFNLLKLIYPKTPSETILLLVLSGIIVLAFLIFLLILVRILLKLYIERRQAQLGSHFKTKMVVAFLGLSIVPVIFLSVFAYGLINRSIDKWFGIPLDVVRRDTAWIVTQLESRMEERARSMTVKLAGNPRLVASAVAGNARAAAGVLNGQALDPGTESLICFDSKGKPLAMAGDPRLGPEFVAKRFGPGAATQYLPPGGLTVTRTKANQTFYISLRPLEWAGGRRVGTVMAVTEMPSDIRETAVEISREAQNYDMLSRQVKAIKRYDLSFLALVTLLILFIAAWLALFMAKQVTVPIQALAAATEEVSRGHLDHRITVRSGDELGKLIQSFNAMTHQLEENRAALERAALDLEAANRRLEERGNTMETILENIPTGVISFDPQGQITRVNSTAERIFGAERAQAARTLGDLFSPDETREVGRLFRRAARQGVLTRQMDLNLTGRRATVALTVSSVHASHGSVGTLMVIEDLSELLRAQKAAAWQEIAQKLAHEIKNPLTPIELSAERIRRWIDRGAAQANSAQWLETVAESSRLISREVAALQSLVDEFARFARFPASHPQPCALNDIVAQALDVFAGRLHGIGLHTELAESLPLVEADPEQMKRVLVNLIDNAAEAMDSSPLKEIWVRTAPGLDRDNVELIVADSGPGISPEAKERLFLPYFSTKGRGSGLGLAIVSRIISEHHGSIRVEENLPMGTRFVIELPAERTPAPLAPA